MKKNPRCFLVVEGRVDGYPNYTNNVVNIVEKDPAEYQFSNLFICSPLFSFSKDGADHLPDLNKPTFLTFAMVPNVHPTFSELENRYPNSKLWFSLGLANLVIIDQEGFELSREILDFLKNNNNLIDAETWEINANTITQHSLYLERSNGISSTKLKISPKLPLSIKFSISEFIISADKFLTGSKKFTPHYFESHKRTIEVSVKKLINDLCFIHGDKSFNPSPSLLNVLKATSIDEAFSNLDNKLFSEKKEEIINDRHGRIIQLNSSLSYLYSQTFAGTFPIFDHIGIVRRHSLLGIGSAIGALYELVTQIEETFSILPFDDIRKTNFNVDKIKSQYLQALGDPSKHHSEIWKDDHVVNKIRQLTKSLYKKGTKFEVPSNYYNRLAFYSGRLGFREYDFSATAAIQVLVESHSLEWHIINYTHEIIHNHVRAILNANIINIPSSIRREDYLTWLEDKLKALLEIERGSFSGEISYNDFFTLVIVKYCINAGYFGSLGHESDSDLILHSRCNYIFPEPTQLKLVIKHLYKEINEIFVHIIDFAYIYRRDIEAYILSIWSSWSTVPSVTFDLKQYIIRTLIVIGVTKSGTAAERYNQARSMLLSLMPLLAARNSSYVFENIKTILENVNDEDLQYRFYNCIIIADIVYNFFIGDIQLLFEKDDERVLGKLSVTTDEENEVLSVYDIDRDHWSQREIKSKTVFLLDQLLHEIKERDNGKATDAEKERTSSWLLLSLSSYNSK